MVRLLRKGSSVLILIIAMTALLFLTRLFTGWPSLGFLGVRPEFRDVVTGLELELDLSRPPQLAGIARLQLREGTQGRIWLLLNRDLRVERASDESGRALSHRDKGRLRSEYHEEARVIAIDLPGPAKVLQLEYSGRGHDGSPGPDWMGVLLLAPDELRMSEQTAFYPQIPREIDGPGVVPWPSRVRLLADPELESYAPGRPSEWPDPPAGGRAWCWESETPTVLSLFAAKRVRRETQIGEARVITLLTPVHADLGEPLVVELEKMLRFYAGLWGPIGARTLGIVEMKSRGDSYNWASQGIVAMEAGALGGEVPRRALAHEAAHLWWGQDVSSGGRGERFLTEGLAEYASWRYVQSTEGESGLQELLAEAQDRWWRSVHDTGVDPALFDVRFGTDGYTDLAYAKGPLALWRLQGKLGASKLDAILSQYRQRMQSAPAGLDTADTFLDAIREGSAGEPLDLSLFELAGHAHLGLKDLAFEGGTARASLVSEHCPAGIPSLSIPRVVIAAYGESTTTRREIALESGGSTAVEVLSPSPILALQIDPEGDLPGVRCETYLAPGVGLLSSDPEDGTEGIELGPLTARLRFGIALAEPSLQFLDRMKRHGTWSALAQDKAILVVRSLSLEDGGRTLLVAIDETMPGRQHVLAIPEGLKSVGGVPIPSLQIAFETRGAGDSPRPRVVSTEPVDGARDVPSDLSRIRIVFSEPMRAGRGFYTTDVGELEDDGWSFPRFGESRWEDPQTLVWELSQPLEQGKRYGLPLGAHYRNRMGVEIEKSRLLFETAP